MSPQTIFITGVTGTQGQAVARVAVSKGWAAHGLVRTPGSATAKSLEAAGVQLTPGDWDNEDAIKTAMTGCTTIFIAMTPDANQEGDELRRVKRIIAIAKAAGVKRAVLSTSLGTDEPDRITAICGEDSYITKSLASKQSVEDAVRGAGFDSHTILRPAYFMANFIEPKVNMFAGFRETNKWTTALLPSTQMPLIDDVDLAKFTLAALEDPARFNGKEIPLSGPVLVPDEIIAALNKATGRQMKCVFLSDEEIQASKGGNPYVLGYLLRDMIHYVDSDEVKSYGIPMNTFEQYLSREKEAVDMTYA